MIAEEYKQYVDKYGKVRDNYEQRMISSCKVRKQQLDAIQHGSQKTSLQNFQEYEANHLNQMKQLVINYANGLEGSYSQRLQV